METLRATAINGTYVIEARGTNDFFVPREKWTSSAPDAQAPALLQTRTQMIRPETNVSKAFQGQLTEFAVSEDGLCISYPIGPASGVRKVESALWVFAYCDKR